MNGWDSLLVKTALSAALIEECVAWVPRLANTDEVGGLRTRVCTPAELKELRAAVGHAKPRLPANLADALEAELREIVADARWVKTDRGRYVRAVNSWVESFHAELRSMPRFADVLVGAHAKREVVFVAGAVESEQVWEALLSYVASKRPPFKVVTDVRIRV